MAIEIAARSSLERLGRGVVVPLLLLAAACGGAEREEIVFGVAAPLSRGFGESARLGAELAAKHLNDAGGVDDRRIVLRPVDDYSDPDSAVAVAERLVADEEVLAVVGHANSGPMMEAGFIYNRDHLPAVGTSATSPAIRNLGPWVFRIASSDSANAVMMAREAKSLGKRIAILYANDDYGRGLARVFRQGLQEQGVQAMGMHPYREEMEDFTPYVQLMKRQGVDLILMAGLETGAATLIRQARTQGLNARVLGGDGLESLLGMEGDYDGTLVGMLFHPEQSDRALAFAQAYRAAYDREPESSAATAYDAVMLLARAAGAVNLGADRDAVRRQIRDYLAQVGRKGGSPLLEGVAGPVAFDAEGDPEEKPFVISEIRDGRFVLFADGK